MDLPGISKKLVADVQKIMQAQRVAEAAVEVEKLDENSDALMAKLRKINSEAIHKKEFEAHCAALDKIQDDHDAHFDAGHVDILKKHGYNKVHSGFGSGHSPEHTTTYAKNHDNGKVSLISVHKRPDRNFGSSRIVKAVNSSGASWPSHSPSFARHVSPKYADKHKTNILPKFEQYVMQVKDSTNSSL